MRWRCCWLVIGLLRFCCMRSELFALTPADLSEAPGELCPWDRREPAAAVLDHPGCAAGLEGEDALGSGGG